LDISGAVFYAAYVWFYWLIIFGSMDVRCWSIHWFTLYVCCI